MVRAPPADLICAKRAHPLPVVVPPRCLIDLQPGDGERTPVLNHPYRKSREVVMAWIEQTGQHSWRVRYPRPTGGYGSISGFTTAKAARAYADDLESDRRHGRWLDPDGAKTTIAAWAARWVDTLDVETRTDENYRAYLRNHILPRWQHAPLGEITALTVTAWIKTLRQRYASSTVDRDRVLDAARRRHRRTPHPRQPGPPPTPPRTSPRPLPHPRRAGVGDARTCPAHRRPSPHPQRPPPPAC